MKPKKIYPTGKLRVKRAAMVDGVLFITRTHPGYLNHPGKQVRIGHHYLSPASKGRVFKILNQRVQEKATKITLAANGFILDFLLA